MQNILDPRHAEFVPLAKRLKDVFASSLRSFLKTAVRAVREPPVNFADGNILTGDSRVAPTNCFRVFPDISPIFCGGVARKDDFARIYLVEKNDSAEKINYSSQSRFYYIGGDAPIVVQSMTDTEQQTAMLPSNKLLRWRMPVLKSYVSPLITRSSQTSRTDPRQITYPELSCPFSR